MPRCFVVAVEAQQQHVVGSVRFVGVGKVSAVQSGHDVESREVFSVAARDTFVLAVSCVINIVNPLFVAFKRPATRLKIKLDCKGVF
jgi:hypothetical protein